MVRKQHYNFFLSIVIDSDKRGTLNVTITIFSDSVLGNTANDTAGFSTAKYIIFGWLWSNFSFFVPGCVQSLKRILTLKQYCLLLYHLAIKQSIAYEQNRFICTGSLTLEQCAIECCYITAIYHWAIRHADCSVIYCRWWTWFLQSADQLHAIWYTFQGGGYRF